MTLLSRSLTVALAAALAGCGASNPPHAPATSCNKAYAGQIAEQLQQIAAGEDVVIRVSKGELSEADMTPAELEAVETMEAILADRARPVDEQDGAILRRASEILANEEIWDRQDDRVCAPEDVTFSLYCALHNASVERLGEYQHRRVAVHEVRFAIEDARPGVEYEHRLRDFNNSPDTRFEDVKQVFATAAQRVEARLEMQRRCEL